MNFRASHMNAWNVRLDRVSIDRACGCILEKKLPGPPVCQTPVVSTDAHLKGVPLYCQRIADSVYESEIAINRMPLGKRIIRMSNQAYVDDFFKDGSLKLGTLSEYAKSEHTEIGDTTEGVSIAVVLLPRATMVFKLQSAECVAFCTYAGDPDPKCIEKFGYDSSFEIIDPIGFAKAIASTIGAENFDYSLCVYRKDKVIVIENPPREYCDMSSISAESFKGLAGASRFFVKPDIYSHQCEFRFVWHKPKRGGRLIKCPDAVQFCKTLNPI